ncbi:DUF2844 domain-containing protein [Noviherbaspirillum cavernae]|nr:DUF2844 domain-containing protein [Noviherbaspirillum cavernae]
MELRRLLLLALNSSLLASPLPALAALGGPPETSQASRPVFAANVASTVTPFTMHESLMPSGTVVREYVAAGGIVFAVSWEGPVQPDLRQFLGPYFQQYLQAASVSRTGRGSLTVNRPGLVAQSVGRMRAFSGKAWVPQFVPQGVSVEQLQ